jgi:RNA polymerase sigma-70 factor (ECF subfamily)
VARPDHQLDVLDGDGPEEAFATLTREEFETLALQQLDGLYAAALHLCKNEPDARDLVHDAYLRAFRFRHKFRAGTNFRGWFYKLMYRLFVNQYHKRSWERDNLTSVDHTHLEPVARDARYDPEAAALMRLDVETLQRAIQQVPETYRAPLILCDVNEFSYEEIAGILDIPMGTVMSRLFRARKHLRGILAELDARPSRAQEGAPIDMARYRGKQRGAGHGV